VVTFIELFPIKMSARPIILILGGGRNIGLGIANKFKGNGYSIAIASRNILPEIEEVADVTVKADFSQPKDVENVFSEVVTKLGHPSVVVYNGEFSYRLKIVTNTTTTTKI
jgi:NAD(P)-dependent dehydrogenase (short-subunit alcohol dehydrogenase family)